MAAVLAMERAMGSVLEIRPEPARGSVTVKETAQVQHRPTKAEGPLVRPFLRLHRKRVRLKGLRFPMQTSAAIYREMPFLCPEA